MYMKPAAAASYFGVTPTTLRRWESLKYISCIKTRGGRRRYHIDGTTTTQSEEKEKIIYTRVSSHKQRDDLQRQCSDLLTKYPDHYLISDIGSGINWKRKGLRTLVERVLARRVSIVRVAYADRLARFAFDLLEWIFRISGTTLLVEKSNLADGSDTSILVEDILTILHVYNCRLQGKRAANKSQDRRNAEQRARGTNQAEVSIT